MKYNPRTFNPTKMALAVVFVLAASITQGYGFSFDIIPTASVGTSLPMSGALSGEPAVESQSGGPNGNYTMVFTFAGPVTSVASVAVSSGIGSIKSSMVDSTNPDQYIVNLTGVADAQLITVNLTDVFSGGHSLLVSTTMGILIGDANGDGIVNSADITLTKSKSGQVVNGSNFQEDINGDGFINSADITLIKSESGTAIPNFSLDPVGPPVRAVPDAGSSATLLGLSLLGLALLRRRLPSA
jgi:VPDSG-CTERM motif/Dockerin type I domain